eukprot:scaffold270869_cov16-Prasinocladus_malaysianus.AAC.1
MYHVTGGAGAGGHWGKPTGGGECGEQLRAAQGSQLKPDCPLDIPPAKGMWSNEPPLRLARPTNYGISRKLLRRDNGQKEFNAR